MARAMTVFLLGVLSAACAPSLAPRPAAPARSQVVAVGRCGELPARGFTVVEGFGGAGDAQLMMTRVVPRVSCPDDATVTASR
jgi:hypothetical protein